jgi:hypothetical protein
LPLGPDGDHKLITLLGPCGRALHAEAMGLERPLQIARVIADPELPLDQSGDALEGPALVGKAGCHGSTIQEPTQLAPRLLIEPRGRSRDGVRFQATQAFLSERGGPAADTGATDPQMPGNLCLGELPLAQQPRCRQTALLHLLRRQMRRTPDVVIHRAPPHEDQHRPMLHPQREDH